MSEPTPSMSVSMETTACPLCGDERSSIVIASRDLHYECPIEFTAVRCEACRHVFLNPRPTCECIGQFYPTDYGPFRPTAESDRQANSQASQSTSSHRRSKFSPRSWPWLRRLVLWWIDSRAAPIPDIQISNFKSQISNLKSQTSPRALELGCARGAFLQQLRDHGWDCIGIEPSPEVALRAKAGGFDVRVGMLESVVAEDSQTFAPGSFDAIFAWMVVEHLHDPLATLRLARELLKPDGTLSFSVPNFGCWEQPAFGRVWHALDLPRHLQHFTTASLLRLLEASGLELVELIHQRNVLNLVGSAGLWLRAKFPRWSLGTRLIRWTDNPTALGLCLLAPLGRILALLRQAGRLTVVARRADSMVREMENEKRQANSPAA